ncbi:MAG: nucleotide exchange factor GrpE [bacterium]
MKKPAHQSDDAIVETDEEFVTINEDCADVSPDQIKKLRHKLKTCELDKAEYLAGWQRAKADYINFKNSEEKSRQETTSYAKESLLHELINLADSFELAFANQEAWNSVPENWRKGVEYIYSNLVNIFDNNGLVEINPLGQDFNPAEQHSIGTVNIANKNQIDKVVEVLKKGYSLKGKVIRPAHVKVGIFQD